MRGCILVLIIVLGPIVSDELRAQQPDAAVSATHGGEEPALRSRARALGYAGVRAYEAGNHREASDLLEEAYRLLPVPSLGLWSARALDKLGRLVEADGRYLETTRLPVSQNDPPVQRASREDAERERASLLPRIPSLRIRLKGAEPDAVTVSIDGVPLRGGALHAPRALDPGEHHVVARRGTEHAEGRAMLQERQHAEVELVFSSSIASVPVRSAGGFAADESSQSRENSPQDHSTAVWRTAAWWTAGVGAAGLALGGVTYAVGRARYNEFESDGICPNDAPCDEQRELDSYETLRTLSGVSLVAGGVLAAAGITVLVVASAPEQDAAASHPIELRVSLGRAELSGRF